MTEAGPAIRARNLGKAFAGRRILDGVSLDVARGEVVALLGPNGAGKTTTVEILEGYRTPDSGEVEVLGAVPWRGDRAWRARIGLMLQEGGVDPRLTPTEALALYGAFHAQPRDVDELLDLVGLRTVAGTRYRRLSGGERQRLSLALALVGRPEVLFLDEPTAGMDPRARAETRSMIRSLAAEGSAVLLTTHDLGDVERCSDRVAILDRGRIVAEGPPGELAGGGGLRLRLSTPLPAADLAARLGGVTVREVDGWLLVLHADPSPELVAAIAGWAAERDILIAELRAGGATLEERYLELTGDREVAVG
jgi:ABC-2 type transport system ATP-binding protein